MRSEKHRVLKGKKKTQQKTKSKKGTKDKEKFLPKNTPESTDLMYPSQRTEHT